MDTLPATAGTAAIAKVNPIEAVAEIKQRLAVVQHAMREVMRENVHYGKIPGCGDKPAMLKPGGEILSMIFRLVPQLEIEMRELGSGHREYIITCTLKTGDTFAGQGVGSCSTMESKFRWRGGWESTGISVPKAYWDTKNPTILSQLVGRDGKFAPKKNAVGQWEIMENKGKEENPDIADTYNTVLKMAKKRALIDAILTATGSSDMFTQDIDELIDPPFVAVKVEPVTEPQVEPEKRGRGRPALPKWELLDYGKTCMYKLDQMSDAQLKWFRTERLEPAIAAGIEHFEDGGLLQIACKFLPAAKLDEFILIEPSRENGHNASAKS